MNTFDLRGEAGSGEARRAAAGQGKHHPLGNQREDLLGVARHGTARLGKHHPPRNWGGQI